MSGPSGYGSPNPYSSNPGGNPDWGASPYSPYAQKPDNPPPQRSWGCGWMLLLVALVGGVPLLCCGMCGGVVMIGLEVVEEEIVADLNTDPIVQQHLGDVKSAELHLWDSLMEEIKNPTGDDEDSWYVFDVEGSKGKGRIIGKSVTNDSDMEELHDGRLILPDGQEFELSK
jgi:hypothetical protein